MWGQKAGHGLQLVLLNLAVSCLLVKGSDVFRCCTPHAWRTTVRTLQASVSQGVNTFSEIWQVVNYDAENERIATTLTLVDGKPDDRRVVLDIRKRARYVIVNETRCTRFDVSGPFSPVCTPHNASIVAFGVAPTLSPVEGVYANTVYYNTKEITGQVTITVGSCALVAETVYFLAEGVNIVHNTQYLNQTFWIDKKAFAVPHDCKPAEQVENFPIRHFGLLRDIL